MTDGASETSPADRIRDFLPLIERGVAASQESRQPVGSVLRSVADCRLLQILAPAAYGGEEASPRDFLELVEAVARIDGSAAWTVMTLNEEMEIACAYLPAASMSTIVSADKPVIVAGAGAPQGRAVRADGGWRVDGRWRLVTGGPIADHIVLATVAEGPKPRSLCYVLLPRSDVNILDTWDTVGLRGTGSHDVELHDVFVPDDWAGITPSAADAVPDSPLFRLPPGLRFPFPKVGVAAGIARSAVESFVALAATKRGRIGTSLLQSQPDAQLAVAEAEALIGSGRAFVIEQMENVWALAVAGEPIPPELHARTRLACSTAVANCVTAVEVIATAAGTTANLMSHPLQRQLADVRAVPQHFMVGGYHRLSAGQVLLGLPADDPLF